MTKREDLLQAKTDMEDILGALDGTKPEIPDRLVIRAMARAMWMILDFLIRRTWGV